MNGVALLLLCAVALSQADRLHLSRSGQSCICNSDEARATCAQYGSDNTLIVHENCNQFYKCSNGQALPYFCPSNLLYNPVEQICDWPNNVECGSRPIVEESDADCSLEVEDNDAVEPDNNNNGTTCNCNPAEAPSLCAADGSDGVLVAHQKCNQFYMCTNGVPVALNCYGNLMYNPYTEKCDWPHNVECGDRPIIDIEDNNNSGEADGDNGSPGTCNCNPGEAPATCAVEGSDGVLVAHENCNQFYKCNNGVPVALSCPTGLLYNPYTEQCDWADKVECGDRPTVEIDGGNGDNGSGNGNGDNGNGDSGNGENGDSNGNGDSGSNGTCNCNPGEAPAICAADGSGGVLVSHENCNQFYKCDHGVPVVLNCPSGLLYNPHTEQCDWPDKVECGDRPIVEIESGGNDGGEEDCSQENGNGNDNEDNGTGTGSCNCNPGEAPAICAVDGSGGVLVAHENCNQFYKCDNGVPVVLNCPIGLLYNPYTEQCDWPDKVECGDRPTVEIDGGNGGNGSGNGNGDNGNGDNGDGNGNEESGSNGTCNCNPGEAPAICAADGSGGVLVAHENCNQFYKCDNGVPVVLNCPIGLLYNPYTEQCDWADKVECGDRPTVEIDGGHGDNGSGNGNGDNGNGDNGDGNGNEESGSNGTCNCNPGEAPAICAADGSGGVLVAHENCNQFYKCDNGVPVVLNCPIGLLYNPYTEQCDWPDKVECADRPTVEIDGGNGDNGSGNGNGDNGNGDNGDGNGNEESGSNGTCNCNPGEAPAICAADGSGGVLVAHENCNQFYKCDNGVPVVLNCPIGLLYNPYTEQCDWADKVECGDRPTVEIDGGNGGNGSGNGNGDNGNGDNGDVNGNGDSGSNVTCNCNPGEAPAICTADGSDGVLVAHENCNQFYKCDNGVPVVLNCPIGLLYNPYTEQCDWADKVECGDRPTVEIDGGNGGNGSGNGNGDNGNGDNGDVNGNGDSGSNVTCNCNPGEAPAICTADGSDGVLVAHVNCNQFYKCSDGLPVVLNCPSGLLYNPVAEWCDWPVNVDCGDRLIVEIEGENNGNGGSEKDDDTSNQGNNNNNSGNCDPSQAPALCAASGSDGVLVAHESCDQFYKCSEGLPVVLSCPSGLLYNPVTEWCDWPENVDCGERVVSGGSDNDGNGSNGNGDNENGNEGTCKCNPSEAPAICATGTSEGVLIAHENCDKFYKCSFGSPVAIACPENLLYNPHTEVCDWSENVQCGERPISDNNGGDDNNAGDNGDANTNTGTNCDPSQAPTICAASGSNGVLVAHENCDQFYVCSYGSPVVLSCPVNLFYNPIIEQCDWPFNVDCGQRVIPEPNEVDAGECLCNSRQAPSICAGTNSDGKMIAHESCNQFYVCFNGHPIARSCPANLFYDPHTMQCNWPLTVNCDGRDVATLSLNKHMQSRRGI